MATAAQAQRDANILFKEGNKIEISNYWWSGFGKFMELPKISYEVKSVKDSSGFQIATLSKKSSQNKGKSIFGKEIQLKRDTDHIFYDLSFWLVDTVLIKELNQKANIKTDTLFYFAIGDPMLFPVEGNLKDELKPYSYLLIETDVFEYLEETKESKTRYEGNKTITTNTNILTPKTSRSDWSSREINFDSRIIEGVEKVHTSAGTYTCYKVVSRDSKAKGMYKNIFIVDYFAPGFGLVRTESYYKKRKLAYSEVTKVN